MTKCKACGQTITIGWKQYLQTVPGYKVHFFSNIGSAAEPKIIRTRLHYRVDIDHDIIRASLILIAAEHEHDKYFRWCDTISSTIEETMERLRIDTLGNPDTRIS